MLNLSACERQPTIVTMEPQIFECGGAEPIQNCSAIPSSELFELFS